MRSDKPWFYAQYVDGPRLQYVDLLNRRICECLLLASGDAWVIWRTNDIRDYSNMTGSCVRRRKKREAIEYALTHGNWEGSPDLWTKILPLKLKYGLIDEELKDEEGN